jgi:hypothetical protein
MHIGLCPVLGLLLLAAGCAGQPAVQTTQPASPFPIASAAGGLPDVDIVREVARLREVLAREVPQHAIANDDATWIAGAQMAILAPLFVIDRAQLVVVIDRNPAVQELRIIVARPDAPWQVIGGSKVSTGQAGRRGYFITPVGVFLHTDGILDYRALGTFNENHIRGLGLKGMRVWDFGWQPAERGWRVERDMAEIRMLMHATDPDYLEQRLGRPASQGCIRVSSSMNRFLDWHGVLDADYERAARDDAGFRAILARGREPTPLAGNALIVLDTSPAS